MPIDISLRHLRNFMAVAEHGSFTRAAHALGRTQPTVTETVRELEQALGVQLMQRTTRRVDVTDEGRAFVEMAHRVLRDFDGIVTDMRGLGNLERGRVRIVAAPSVATLILPTALGHFAAQYPGVRVALADVTSREAERQLLAGQADFAFTSRWSQDKTLAFEPLLTDLFGVVMPHNHLLAASSSPLDWAALASERCIGLTDATGIRAIIREETGLPQSVINPFYEAATTTSLDMMVQQGLGIAVLPALAAARAPLSALSFRPLANPAASRALGILTRADQTLSIAAQHLTGLIRRALPELDLPSHVVRKP
ncbi:MAG: LysR family transcriptional regulator [Beijerinckiaceae bacterium]